MPVFVNGVEIGDHAINAEVQYHPAGSVEEARAGAARALAVRELLLQAATAASGPRCAEMHETRFARAAVRHAIMERPDA